MIPAQGGDVLQTVALRGDAGGPRFDGIGLVNGGGATSVLLKDYPEPQRSQILDFVYKPNFGASISTMLVEIPGDGNSTQGSMPSHMHTRDDLDYSRGYTWWVLREAKKRNPEITLDGAAWSAPGWIGGDPEKRFPRENPYGDAKFWSQDAVDYYLKWLQGLRKVHGLEMDAIGCRNEKGVSYGFVKALRQGMDANGFQKVRIHAFDNWPKWKMDFVKDMLQDPLLRDSIDAIGGHTFQSNFPTTPEVREMAAKMGKPIWNTEDHVYKKGFDCAISIVECFNENHIVSGVTKVVNWYDIAGIYPMEPYAEDPAAVLAHSPWSGCYQVREALWGYAHYGQFTRTGWQYLVGGSGKLDKGGTYVTLKSPGDDYSIIIETKDAKGSQQLRFQTSGLSEKPLCVWRSNAREQFVKQPGVNPDRDGFTLTLDPDSIYSLSTTTGQQKGAFVDIPADKAFPFPYFEDFESYDEPSRHGYLPRYTADIAGAFEVSDRPDKNGRCLRQVVARPTISWSPDWQPYTIIGDVAWKDYEVSADVWLNADDSAAVMGRVNHVGTGFGFIPKGYYARLDADGDCHLILVRGKKDRKKATGDAEQQRIIAASKDEGEGGEKSLGKIHLKNVRAGQWHQLKLRFEGVKITAFVDGKPVLTADDSLYDHGMAGLLAGQDKQRTSTPWFDNLRIHPLDSAASAASRPSAGQTPIYGKQ